MRTILTLALLLSFVTPVAAQPRPEDPEARAIRQTALDYIEGWYERNVERMTRALHPELVKRIVVTSHGATRLDDMGASKLISFVRTGGGKDTPKERQLKEVTILDRYENAAVAKIIASDWIDYLQLGKVDGRWVIINVLWEHKPEPPKKK